MKNEELDILITKLEKYRDFCMTWGKKLILSYIGIFKSSIEFGILAFIFFYIYKVAGRDFTFILLAIGIIIYGMRNKGELYVIQKENEELKKKMLEKKG